MYHLTTEPNAFNEIIPGKMKPFSKIGNDLVSDYIFNLISLLS